MSKRAIQVVTGLQEDGANLGDEVHERQALFVLGAETLEAATELGLMVNSRLK